MGANLKTKEAYIKANTGALVQVWVTEKLDASAGSGASVEYAGTPAQKDIKQTFGGKVEKMQ
jgi:hypothetical protein